MAVMKRRGEFLGVTTLRNYRVKASTVLGKIGLKQLANTLTIFITASVVF
jgi:hypothetical protein